MPDFDTRKPPGANEPYRPRIVSIANKIRTLLMANKPRILSIASSLRRPSTANRPRTLLIGGGVLLFVVAVGVGLFLHPFGGPGGLQQAYLGEASNGKLA